MAPAQDRDPQITVTRLRHARYVIVWQPVIRLPGSGQPAIRQGICILQIQRPRRLRQAPN